jgi:3alpha(or 20beta)-hydroxysteroid dehydrogenase
MIADILEPDGMALAAELGTAARFVRLDVTDETSWHAAIGAVQSAFGGLDILVNNAGLFDVRLLVDCGVDDYLRIVRVNQLGSFIGMKTSAEAMKARGGGSIVNISSVLGMVGSAGTMAYTATKFALRGMTKVAALELASHQIRVNSVHPGLIETDMVRDLMAQETLNDLVKSIPMKRIGTGRDVAKLVLFLASDESAFCTGSEFTCDGGETASSSNAS